MKIKSKKNNKIITLNIKKIKNSKGNILKILSSKNKFFNNFGDCYLSEINPYQIKAWRYHKKSTQNIFLINGKCKIVVFKNNRFYQINLSEKLSKLIIIPRNYWYGFKNIGSKTVKLLNIVDKNYSEKEVIRKKQNEINYDW